MIISSPQNPRVKAALRLRDRRHREKQGRIVIDGAREIGRALAAGVQVTEAYVCPSLCRSEDALRALELVRTAGEVIEVTPAVFERLAFGERTDGLVVVAETPRRTLADLRLPALEAPLVAVIEGVEKPGNFGAILRSADGAGMSAVLAADPRTDLFNPNTIRASLGTVFLMPLAAADAAAALRWLAEQKLQIVAARVEGAVPYNRVDYSRPTAIVLGSEAEGLSDLWHGAKITAVALPMCGVADSLNVSAAAAVLFYEARRQRGARG